jgi:IS30 family transposase
MSTEKEIEQRRRKVQELLRKGYTQNDIAEKLGVHHQTVHNDVQAVNDRYKKLVSENPEYLSQQLEKILKFIDDFDALMREYWELKEQASNQIEVTDKKGNKKIVPLGTVDDQRKVLDSIRQVIVEKAKILKLISGDNKYLQQNYIHIENINSYIVPIMNSFKQVIKKYVPNDRQSDAFNTLKQMLENNKEEVKLT